MKKLYFLAAAAAFALTAQAEEFTLGGINYACDPNDGSCEVVGYEGAPRVVNIPAQVEYEGATYHVDGVGPSAFYGCPSLQTLTLPEGLKYISESAFRQCEALKEVVIPNTVTSVENHAFYQCTNAEKLVLSEAMTVITAQSFAEMASVKVLEIPESVVTIENEGCNFMESLTQLTFGEGLEEIGSYGFGGCGISSLELPQSLKKIGEYAFDSNKNLAKIDFGGIIEIPYCAFAAAKSLVEVVIPDCVTSIAGSAFKNCGKLKSVNTGNGVKTLGDGAFIYSNSLKTVVLGASVESLGTNCFRNGNGTVTGITSLNPVPPVLGGNAFDPQCKQTAKVNVPADALEAYKASESWSGFVNLEGLEVGIETVESPDGDTAVWYDLAGRRMAQPGSGVYVKVSGGHAAKVAR